MKRELDVPLKISGIGWVGKLYTHMDSLLFHPFAFRKYLSLPIAPIPMDFGVLDLPFLMRQQKAHLDPLRAGICILLSLFFLFYFYFIVFVVCFSLGLYLCGKALNICV